MGRVFVCGGEGCESLSKRGVGSCGGGEVGGGWHTTPAAGVCQQDPPTCPITPTTHTLPPHPLKDCPATLPTLRHPAGARLLHIKCEIITVDLPDEACWCMKVYLFVHTAVCVCVCVAGLLVLLFFVCLVGGGRSCVGVC